MIGNNEFPFKWTIFPCKNYDRIVPVLQRIDPMDDNHLFKRVFTILPLSTGIHSYERKIGIQLKQKEQLVYLQSVQHIAHAKKVFFFCRKINELIIYRVLCSLFIPVDEVRQCNNRVVIWSVLLFNYCFSLSFCRTFCHRVALNEQNTIRTVKQCWKTSPPSYDAFHLADVSKSSNATAKKSNEEKQKFI